MVIARFDSGCAAPTARKLRGRLCTRKHNRTASPINQSNQSVQSAINASSPHAHAATFSLSIPWTLNWRPPSTAIASLSIKAFKQGGRDTRVHRDLMSLRNHTTAATVHEICSHEAIPMPPHALHLSDRRFRSVLMKCPAAVAFRGRAYVPPWYNWRITRASRGRIQINTVSDM